MSIRMRIIIVIILLLFAIGFLSSTLQWYLVIPEEKKELAASSIAQIKEYAEQQAAGDYRVIAGLVEKQEELPPLGQSLARTIETAIPYNNSQFEQAYKEKLEAENRDDILYLKDFRSQTLQLGLDLQGGMYVIIEADFATLEAERKLTAEARGEEYQPLSDLEREEKILNVLDILNNRIDQFGVTEPQISRQVGSNQIIIQLPGAADPERINKVIIQKGNLNFHLVNKDAFEKFTEYRAANRDVIFAEDGVTLKDPDIIPKGSVLRGVYTKDEYGNFVKTGYTVISEVADFRGEHITNARADIDNLGRDWYVRFELDGEGTTLFSELTKNNIGEGLAIVLDDKVRSAPVINSQIPTGVGSITGRFTQEEANDLALLLRSGSLPVPLKIVSQSAVGASLGEDAINQGLYALLIGFLLVILFMILYYKGAGLISVLALVLNIFFMASILSITGFTLTLTSIAGVLLTVGMAVDANVIIFERIKEEYRIGKSAKASVKAGFSKAFSAVVDANITTFIAAFTLSWLGTGTIQGFAFTLSVGIISSLITALFISRIFFDIGTDVFNSTKLSISWRSPQ